MEDMTRMARVRTPRQFLDRRQELETQRLLTALQVLGDDVERLTEVEQRVRRHPLAAVGMAAGLGVVLGPRLLPGLWRTLGAAGVAGIAAAQPAATLYALLPDALRERLSGSERREPS